jgi:hypothetical protein
MVLKGTQIVRARAVEDLEQRMAYCQYRREAQTRECIGRLLSQREEFEKQKERMIADHEEETVRLTERHAGEVMQLIVDHGESVNDIRQSYTQPVTGERRAQTPACAVTEPRRLPNWKKKEMMKIRWRQAPVLVSELHEAQGKRQEAEKHVRELEEKLAELKESASLEVCELRLQMEEAQDRACELLKMLLRAPATNTDNMLFVKLALESINEVWEENVDEVIQELEWRGGKMSWLSKGIVRALKSKFVDDLGRKFVLGLPLVARVFPDEERAEEHVVLNKIKARLELPIPWEWMHQYMPRPANGEPPFLGDWSSKRRSEWV